MEQKKTVIQIQQKTVRKIIDEVKEEICDDYCRYPKEAGEEEGVMDICTLCPLNKL